VTVRSSDDENAVPDDTSGAEVLGRKELVVPDRTDPLRLSADELHAFAVRALSSLGFAPLQAQEVATAMVWADLRGLAPHGVVRRLAQCAARVRAGGTDPRAVPLEDPGETSALVTMDAHHAWGQVSGVTAIRRAVQLAQDGGVGLVAVRRTGSPAALGYYPTLAMGEGLIGVALTNCPALMAAPEGTRRVLGNQAHAFGFPAGSAPPVLFDSSLSEMSTGEMDRRMREGERLPEGVLRDRDGRPTDDPADWVDGFLTPIGGYRGFGLALSFELLTSALAGSDAPSYAVGPPVDHATPQDVSLTCLAIDPGRLSTGSTFTDRVDRVVDAVRSSGARGGPPPRVPGERGRAIADQRRRDGVPVTWDELRALERLAGELLVPPPAPSTAGAAASHND
jgi:LDH2 family malate/lactate/ureidoglycolate dehydrogenase